jgi:hypothetical protein
MNYKEDIDVVKRPFLISTKEIKDNFGDIWNNWSEFYTSTKYIADLFYEIICNRSTRINRFLNLTQALEIYSSYYRDDQARNLAKENGFSNTPFKFRIEDIFRALNSIFKLDSIKLRKLSVNISNMRHFFTHYNRHKYTEPSIHQIFAATRVLRFALLALVYKTIGISDSIIENCMKRNEYKYLYQDIDLIVTENEE